MKNKGTLYGVGVGPGDPELLTLKAVSLLRACPVVAVPQSGSGESVALGIARQAVPELAEKELLELRMPMTRDAQQLEQSHRTAAQQLTQVLDRGLDVAMVTLGDPSIYSTYSHLHKRVQAAGYPVQMVAGVPSFCAVAARLNLCLAEGAQPLHIIPASYHGTAEGLEWSGPKVLMKAGRSIPKVRELLRERGLLGRARLVQRCGMEGEQVYSSMEEVPEDASYFSLILVEE